MQSYTHVHIQALALGAPAAELTRGTENEEEEEALVVGGGDMYSRRDEHMGKIDTLTQSYAYMHTYIVCVCVLQP